MSDIYVFSASEAANDYSTMGLVGALTPTSCTFRETANGESLIELEHPLDSFGRYTALERGHILVVPVPVRTTPEIQNGQCVTTVWRYKIKPLAQLTSKAQRTLYKKKTGGGTKKLMPAETLLTVVQKPAGEDARWKVKTPYGDGWVAQDGLELVTEHTIPDNSAAIEEIESPWTVRDQYFRIYEVEKNVDSVSVSARHISYDLLLNLSKFNEENSQTLEQALTRTLGETYISHDFSAHTNVSNEHAGLLYRNRNPIDIFLNEEDGLCKRYNVSLVRDNYDLYFLHDPGLNRGVSLEYGKNLTGITFTTSDEELATRIIPVGENKDGSPLYLADTNVDNAQCVDSPKIGDYPLIHAYLLECENCTVGEKDESGGTITVAIARARMRKQAEDMLEGGCDEPKIEMRVDFINLGDTEEYAQFRGLENCFLYDYVTVRYPRQSIDVTAQISEIEWNCLTGRMEKVTIGTVGKTLANAGICTWQIPSGFSGGKIAGGTLGSGALKDGVINVRHMQAESINADALQAACVTAVKIAAGAVTADKLDANTVDAKIANLVVANITNANIEWAEIEKLNAAIAEISKAHLVDADIEWANIANLTAQVASIAQAEIENATITTAQIDNLSAAVAEIVHLQAQIGDFTLAEIKNLLANALILQEGLADNMMIKNLVVTSANLLCATVDQLVVKGADGKYYRIQIDSDGAISTDEVTVTEDELAAGETNDGRQIVASTANVGSLNATTVKASQAILATIFTESLDAGVITAGEALIASAKIPALYVTALNAIGGSINLSANESITALVSSTEALDGRLSEAEQRITRDAIISTVTESTEFDELADSANDALARAKNAQTQAETAQSSADAAAAATNELRTTVTQTANALSVVKTETSTLGKRVTTIESGVHIDGSTIGLYRSDSPYKSIITNSGWKILEGNAVLIDCSKTKLTAPRVVISDMLVTGNAAWKPGSDKHLRLLSYGRR